MADRPMALLVDDDPGVRSTIERFVRRLDFDVTAHAEGHEALGALESARPDVALVDLQMPGIGGLDVLRAIRERAPECQVILFTGQPTVETALEAIKLGARDYLTKPLPLDRLRELLAGIRDDRLRRRELLAAERQMAARVELGGMIGRSAVMQVLFDRIRRFAPHMRTGLVTGETGTGKELVARALHDLGPRRSRPFRPYNCSAIVDTLAESEFFGHTRGAFTGAVDAKRGLFEGADGGTVFLDEIGDLPLPQQAKLLRVLESGEVQRVGATHLTRVDVLVIGATNRTLPAETRAGRFREDLFYRLNVVEIALPALRDRREDIPYLTAAFLHEFASRFGKAIDGLTPAAERLLQEARWPGNIRQLRNVIERACMLCDGSMMGEGDIRPLIAEAGSYTTRIEPAPVPLPRRPAVAPAIARERIETVLRQTGGNLSETARTLGISRRALYRRLDALGLRPQP